MFLSSLCILITHHHVDLFRINFNFFKKFKYYRSNLSFRRYDALYCEKNKNERDNNLIFNYKPNSNDLSSDSDTVYEIKKVNEEIFKVKGEIEKNESKIFNIESKIDSITEKIEVDSDSSLRDSLIIEKILLIEENNSLIEVKNSLLKEKNILRRKELLILEEKLILLKNEKLIFKIPLDRPWEREKGVQLPHSVLNECPKERLVNVDKTISEAVEIIIKNLPLEGRIPPLAITRMHRGGKTTILKLLYEYFEENKELNVLPIIISINLNFALRKDESNLMELIRLIATQFIITKEGESSNNFYCSEKDLVEYINKISHGRSVVLFIDELNKFGVPGDSEISNFLKRVFLDRPGRYLVFTSHVMLDIDPLMISQSSLKAGNYLESYGSSRDMEIVTMPRSTDKSLLQKMSLQCASITDLEIAFYGGIPSLLQSLKTSTDIDIITKLETLLKDNNLPENPEAKTNVLRRFLSEVRTGERSSLKNRLFDGFADHFLLRRNPDSKQLFEAKVTNMIVWPLCYISEILQLFDQKQDLSTVLKHLQSFMTYEKDGNKGLEMICICAIYLRALEASLLSFGDERKDILSGPFGVAENDKISSVELIYVPSSNLEDMYEFLKTNSVISRKQGTVSICIPTNSMFTLFNVVIVYWKSSTEFNAIGCQIKQGKETPNSNAVIPDWISKAILLRGNAPTAIHETGKWIYYDNKSIIALLGYSLSRLYPFDQ